VLSARGFLLKLDGRCREATASYQLALSFDASDTEARDGLALCAVNLGHPDEAEQQLREILAIDPENPKNRDRYNQLGLVSLMRGRGDEAIDWFLKSAAGEPDPTGPTESLTRQEWNEIGLIAAYGMTGKAAEAKARYANYARIWPHRTVWRLASYFTKAEAGLPGFQAMLGALKAAGMPAYADDGLNGQVMPTPNPRIAGDFEPTPPIAPGARTITTPELAALLAGESPPVVVDVGCGAGVIPGALWIVDNFPSNEAQSHLKSEVERATGGATERGIVVMGCNKYGWNSYNAALALIGLGYRDIAWYRGGEEAWAAAGMKAEDRRDP
jgi:tetratricopeptide (TPR) repeat protein